MILGVLCLGFRGLGSQAVEGGRGQGLLGGLGRLSK